MKATKHNLSPNLVMALDDEIHDAYLKGKERGREEVYRDLEKVAGRCDEYEEGCTACELWKDLTKHHDK